MGGFFFNQTSCIVLSAGSSERMGTHKALLKFGEQTTFIGHITETYQQAGLNQVIVVVSHDLYRRIEEAGIGFADRVSLVINPYPESGRFYSLQTGIRHIKPGNFCFFQNIDNPFTSNTILSELLQYKDTAEVIIPTFKGKSGHPVLISPKVAVSIANTTYTEQRINEFLKTFPFKKVEVNDRYILANINSANDYNSSGFIM